eukprot:14844-Heterococcus_DN1.PRE.4
MGGGASPGELEVKDNLLVRDAFVCTMAELLGGIGGFVRRSEVSAPTESVYSALMLQVACFECGASARSCTDVEASVRPFLERLTTTQQWLESSERDDELLFFQECVTVHRNRQAGAVVPYGDDSDSGRVQVRTLCTASCMLDPQLNAMASRPVCYYFYS